MALPASYDNKDDAPADLQEHLVERDGKFYVEVEGMKTAADFSSLNEAIRKRLTDGLAELRNVADKGIGREDLLKLIKETSSKVTDNDSNKGGGDSSQVRELQAQLKTVTEALEAIKTENQQSREQAAQSTVKSVLTTAVTGSKPIEECVGTVTSLLRGSFELTADGEVKSVAGCEFGSGLTPDEVLGKIKKDPRFPFWKPSKGGGASSDSGGGGGEGGDDDENPWTAQHWNRTKQVTIQKADVDKAKRLAKQAGSSLNATRPPKSS